MYCNPVNLNMSDAHAMRVQLPREAGRSRGPVSTLFALTGAARRFEDSNARLAAYYLIEGDTDSARAFAARAWAADAIAREAAITATELLVPASQDA
jgi:hypothetical protein